MLSDFFMRNRYLSYHLVLLMDLFLSVLSTALSYLLVRYFSHGQLSGELLLPLVLVSAILGLVSFLLLRTHHNIIRHSSFKSAWQMAAAALFKSGLILCSVIILPELFPIPLHLGLMGSLLDLLITFLLLVGVRAVLLAVYDLLVSRAGSAKLRVLVYGVGDKSVALKLRLHQSAQYHIIGFITYGKRLKSYKVSDLPVYYFCSNDDFRHVLSRTGANAVLFATQGEVVSEQERLVRYCESCPDRPVKTLIVPAVDEFVKTDSPSHPAPRNSIREVKIEDLLGRDEITINREEVHRAFSGKVVMVTGGAGSIGSELCRQMAQLGVSRLIIFDNAETPLHEIRLELEKTYPELNLVPFIGDVRNPNRLRMVFDLYHPEVVFHAAAYKHVPLMEENPCEAIRSNVVGTRNVADFCVKYDVERMVMISTDKAVNPTNVIGATKRLAEIYTQSLGLAITEGRIKSRTRFVTTRFGNVLGSNGSVIPLFRRQIAAGGPVTVTHPDINRFFMTIPEACRLVMEAATMSGGNEIFVFEMGSPVRIADLARRMIKLAGFEPERDIRIEYTGLRPGEKLYEEVLSNEENTKPTGHRKIKIASVRQYRYEEVLPSIDELGRLALDCQVMESVRKMKQIVPEFKSNNSRFEELDKERDDK